MNAFIEKYTVTRIIIFVLKGTHIYHPGNFFLSMNKECSGKKFTLGYWRVICSINLNCSYKSILNWKLQFFFFYLMKNHFPLPHWVHCLVINFCNFQIYGVKEPIVLDVKLKKKKKKQLKKEASSFLSLDKSSVTFLPWEYLVNTP